MFTILTNTKEVGDWFMRINIHHDEALVKHEIFSNKNKSWLATHSPLSTDNWH